MTSQKHDTGLTRKGTSVGVSYAGSGVTVLPPLLMDC